MSSPQRDHGQNGNDYWLANLRITDESDRNTAKPGTVHRLEIGDNVPDLPLVNQDGKSYRLGDFKGNAVLITFIYTRCPVPTFCPRLSGQFVKIQDDFAKTPVDFALLCATTADGMQRIRSFAK